MQGQLLYSAFFRPFLGSILEPCIVAAKVYYTYSICSIYGRKGLNARGHAIIVPSLIMQSKLTHPLRHALLHPMYVHTYLQSTLQRHGASKGGQAAFPRGEAARRSPGGRRHGPGASREAGVHQGPRRMGRLRQAPLRQQEGDDGGRVQQRLHQKQEAHVLHMGEWL